MVNPTTHDGVTVGSVSRERTDTTILIDFSVSDGYYLNNIRNYVPHLSGNIIGSANVVEGNISMNRQLFTVPEEAGPFYIKLSFETNNPTDKNHTIEDPRKIK